MRAEGRADRGGFIGDLRAWCCSTPQFKNNHKKSFNDCQLSRPQHLSKVLVRGTKVAYLHPVHIVKVDKGKVHPRNQDQVKLVQENVLDELAL
jgi:hypothetical protein